MTLDRLPRLVIAAPHSHAGKTTVTLALMAALFRRGLQVAPFKVGPDYIDPQLHRRASGRSSYNLDTYLVPVGQVLKTFGRASHDADVAIIEGVMGLFDGSSPTSQVGSTADVATQLAAPIVLVIDAAGMAASVGALVHGFRTYDPAVSIAGVILNRLGSAGHYQHLLPALEREGVKILGYLPKEADLVIPERHLGLLPASEVNLVTLLLDRLVELTEQHIDLDGVIELAGSAPPLPSPVERQLGSCPSRIRVAWARDEAFHFEYKENLDLLTAAGAEIVPFSPLHDEALPEAIDAVWLGGGFPELFAAPLAANAAMRTAIRQRGQDGLPIYAECGGLMYLCSWLEDQNGQRHSQVGLISGGTRMTTKLQQFGYAEATFRQDTLFGPAGTSVRGHRFHYSVYDPGDETGDMEPACAYDIQRARTGETRQEGFCHGNVLATYFHMHLGSQPDMASHFVEFCAARSARQAGG